MWKNMKMPFGKHQGRSLSEILDADPGYLQRILKSDEVSRDPDLSWGIKRALEAARRIDIYEVDMYLMQSPPYDDVAAVARLSLPDPDAFIWSRKEFRVVYNSDKAKAGPCLWEIPEEDGVYEILVNEEYFLDREGAEASYWFRYDGDWYHIKQGAAGATAVLRILAEQAMQKKLELAKRKRQAAGNGSSWRPRP